MNFLFNWSKLLHAAENKAHLIYFDVIIARIPYSIDKQASKSSLPKTLDCLLWLVLHLACQLLAIFALFWWVLHSVRLWNRHKCDFQLLYSKCGHIFCCVQLNLKPCVIRILYAFCHLHGRENCTCYNALGLMYSTQFTWT